jgi:hypothetical protein
MLRSVNATGDMKVKIFSGEAAKIEKDIADFLEKNKVKVHSFAQSQSSIANDFAVNVTATILYTLYDSHEEKIGFNR